MEFEPLHGQFALSPGIVLRVQEDAHVRLLRVTHLFPAAVYVMRVSTGSAARDARRPLRLPLTRIQELLREATTTVGRMTLPPSLLSKAGDSTTKPNANYQDRLNAIQPLIDQFEYEDNLRPSRFAALIHQRAQEIEQPLSSIRRLLLRYYYFGRTPIALLPLPRGPAPDKATVLAEHVPATGRRRGRKAIDEFDLGANGFVVSNDDIQDMCDCVDREVSHRVVQLTERYNAYLREDFSRRHPAAHVEWLNERCPVPVTLRQFRYYVRTYGEFTTQQLQNMPSRRAGQPKLGFGYANGPGDIYEIDATGGRVFLVDPVDPRLPVQKPTIYFVIDRWSRFIVGFYATMSAPAWEEVRFALLVSLTSRVRRFKALGFHVNEDRWPVGRVPAALVQDRGAEFLSSNMAQVAAKNLGIELYTLPPLCPDGKAVIERLNRDAKAHMARLPGSYAERPLKPETKRVMRKAMQRAFLSLHDLYGELLDFVDKHNNSPHSHLKKIPALRQLGVSPTPRDAYVWGLENVSGIHASSLSDNDFKRLLLGSATGNIAAGIVSWGDTRYEPDNQEALSIAANSPIKRRKFELRVDMSDPSMVWSVADSGAWARWRRNAGDAYLYMGRALEDVNAQATGTALRNARAKNKALISEVSGANKAVQHGKAKPAIAHIPGARNASEAIKGSVMNRNVRQIAKKPVSEKPAWLRLEEADNARVIEEQRKKRK